MLAETFINTKPQPFKDSVITDDEGFAMFRAAVNLFALWNITDKQAAILLDMSPRTFARNKTDGIKKLSRDGKARLSNIMGIHKGLRSIFRTPQQGYSWIKKPNDAFSKQSALDVMLEGNLTDLMRVRRYLDAERGAW